MFCPLKDNGSTGNEDPVVFLMVYFVGLGLLFPVGIRQSTARAQMKVLVNFHEQWIISFGTTISAVGQQLTKDNRRICWPSAEISAQKIWFLKEKDNGCPRTQIIKKLGSAVNSRVSPFP